MRALIYDTKFSIRCTSASKQSVTKIALKIGHDASDVGRAIMENGVERFTANPQRLASYMAKKKLPVARADEAKAKKATTNIAKKRR